jgi:hypothetical protein
VQYSAVQDIRYHGVEEHLQHGPWTQCRADDVCNCLLRVKC